MIDMRPASSMLALASVLVLVACEPKQPDTKAAAADQPGADEAAAKPAAEPEPEPETKPMPKPNDVTLDHSVKLLDGSEKSLAEYRGKALLVVNTASECGFTPQYADLQQLYATYKDRGLEVLAFPSNDFGGQEPGTPEQIREFVDGKFDVEFEMFDKVVIKGEDKAPLYRTLTEETGEGIKGEVKWNFTKFLVDPQGRVVARFEPPVKPMDAELIAAIEHALPGA